MPGASYRLVSRAAWPLLAWLPMLWWFAAFRPGLMSGDSLDSWRQATEGDWKDLQPPLYTAAMWLSHTLVGSPSLLTLAQSLLLAASIAAVGGSLVRLGLDSRLVIAVCGIVVSTPMVGAFSISLWKDIPFTAAVLFVLARLIDLVANRLGADGPAPAATLQSIFLWSAFAVLIRQNGILVAGVVLAVVWLVARELRARAAVALVACVGVLIGAKVVAYPLLGVERGPANSEIATMLHDVASVAAQDPAALDDGDRALLETIAPIEVWAEERRRFGCTSANWQYLDAFDWDRLDGEQRRYVTLWFELLGENPWTVIKSRVCAGSIAWRPDNRGLLYTASRGVDPNEFGLRTVPVVRWWHDVGVDVLDALNRKAVQPFVWRAPAWLYMSYAVVGFTAWRRRRAILLLPLALPAAQQVAVVVLNPAQDARYLMAGLIGAWLLLPMAAVPIERRGESSAKETPLGDDAEPVQLEEVVPT